MSNLQDTIVGLATPAGPGALAIIRMSGSNSVQIANALFQGIDLLKVDSHTIHFGTMAHNNEIIDEVVVSLFLAPHSYTKEDVVEINCHGSSYIIEQLMRLFLDQGARLAKPGEFTQRAFLHGRFDLVQAEAVADLIASENEIMHLTALKQMKGGFSREIKKLREKLVHFASLIELELDFSDEDVEFAERKQIFDLINEILQIVTHLLTSFRWGNVIKNGISVVIIGAPNVGKSTLLNALLQDDKAIISDIPGTTRDVIEDVINLENIKFRFLDTAGLRNTPDAVEAMGIQRTKEQIQKGDVLLYLIDLKNNSIKKSVDALKEMEAVHAKVFAVGNKMDLVNDKTLRTWQKNIHFLPISAAKGDGIDQLQTQLVTYAKQFRTTGNQTIITNFRHQKALQQTQTALQQVVQAITENLSGDLLAADIKIALHYLGEITGEITTEDMLDNIFSKFCIGK